MTCREFQSMVSAYLDRELETPDIERMAAHAETCARCQAERSLIVKFKSTFREKVMPGIPADLVAAIEAQTFLKRTWWKSDLFRTRWVPALVGLATAVGALWLSKTHVNPRRETWLPIAARPRPGPVVTHAFLPTQESSDHKKGAGSENPKS